MTSARGVATLVAALAVLAACGDEPKDDGAGSGARPVTECPTSFDGTFEEVGRFPVRAPGVDFAITGDRVAYADANGSASYDVRLVGLAGASAPNLDVALLEAVSPLPVTGEVDDGHAPLQLAAARDGVVTAHGKGKDVVVTRFDRAGYQQWQTIVPTADYAGEVDDLTVLEDRVQLRLSDLDDYPGSYAAHELAYSSGELQEWREAGDEVVLERLLDRRPERASYQDFGVTAGPPVSLPDEGRGLALNDEAEPPEGAVQCGEVTYWISGVDLWVVPGPEGLDRTALGTPVRVDAVPEVVRHAAKGDGAVLGITPDAVWVGWSDYASGDGTLFALAY